MNRTNEGVVPFWGLFYPPKGIAQFGINPKICTVIPKSVYKYDSCAVVLYQKFSEVK